MSTLASSLHPTPIAALVYDVEIENCLPENPGPNLPQFKYCGGWGDYAGMGIACIGAYDYLDGKYKFFVPNGKIGNIETGSLADFQELVMNRPNVIGFNSLAFDDKLCTAHGLQIKTTYDILVEIRRATGQPLNYVRGRSRSGYNLDSLAQANFNEGKSGDGALAPKLWQQGRHEEVINYCMRDVELTRRLLDNHHRIIDPNDRREIRLPLPFSDPKANR